MSVYKATAVVSFTFQHDGSPGQAKIRADEMVEKLIYETDEANLTTVTSIEKLEIEPPVMKLREYPLDKIFSLIDETETETKRHYFTVNKVKYGVKITSDRYKLFKNNRKCVSCGLEGTRLFLERHTASCDQDNLAHFNLYGEEKGKLILMTKDHIKARSFGGANNLSNYETLCSICNTLKSSYPLGYDAVAKMRDIYNKKRDFPEMN